MVLFLEPQTGCYSVFRVASSARSEGLSKVVIVDGALWLAVSVSRNCPVDAEHTRAFLSVSLRGLD